MSNGSLWVLLYVILYVVFYCTETRHIPFRNFITLSGVGITPVRSLAVNKWILNQIKVIIKYSVCNNIAIIRHLVIWLVPGDMSLWIVTVHGEKGSFAITDISAYFSKLFTFVSVSHRNLDGLIIQL